MVVGVSEEALEDAQALEEEAFVLLVGDGDAADELDRVPLDEKAPLQKRKWIQVRIFVLKN